MNDIELEIQIINICWARDEGLITFNKAMDLFLSVVKTYCAVKD